MALTITYNPPIKKSLLDSPDSAAAAPVPDSVVSPILSAPAPADGGRDGARGGTAPLGAVLSASLPDCSLYPVYVTSNHSLNIPGVMADCGKEDRVYKRQVVCEKDASHISYSVGGNSCGDPGCPRHWTTWARQAADRVGLRIEGFRQATRTRYPPRKIILSIDEENPILKTWRVRGGDISAVKKARAYFIRQAEKIGCSGGSMVIHLWRTNEKVPSYIEGSKKWDYVRSQGPRWREFVRYSPHAHIIGYGYLRRVSRTEEDFAYKNMGPLTTRDAVESVAFYNLSHASLGKGITAVIYFGCCSYGKLRCTFKYVRHDFAVCPVCGAYLVDSDTREYITHQRTFGDFEAVAGPPSMHIHACPKTEGSYAL